MRIRSVWLATLLVALFVGGAVIPAAGWELKLSGNYTYEYEYISQMGSQGFFGRFDRDARAVGTANAYSLNAWLGAEARDLLVSGSDGAWQTMYMQMDMDLHLNPAIRLRGRYWIGGWDYYLPSSSFTAPNTTTPVIGVSAGVPLVPTATSAKDRDVRPYLVHSEYIQYSSPGIQRSFSPGYWNTLWLTATTPWGIVTMGKRPSVFGMGLSWDGEDNRSSETLSLFADYGPFRIGLAGYTARGGFENYFNDYHDKNGLRKYDVGPTFTYRNGPLDIGFTCTWVLRHRGAERVLAVAGTASGTKGATGSRDREDFYGGVYIKYNNGRFFWNSEFDWYDRRETNVSTYPFVTLGGVPYYYVKNYTQEYRVAAETGCLAGPAKVSLLYAWLSGADRRNGTVFGINQGYNANPFSNSSTSLTAIDGNGLPQAPRWDDTSLSNTGMFRPYSYLMVYNYGLGAFINADTGNGYAQDASCWGARVDYAVAANLNVYASFFKANRVGNGYGWGFLVPSAEVLNSQNPQGLVRQSFKFGITGGFNFLGDPAPNIPDNDLGYELGLGFDWKLLEGLKVSFTSGWWQPGNWFKFACVDKATNANWASGWASTNNFGINPDRAIDPIFGIECKVIGEF